MGLSASCLLVLRFCVFCFLGVFFSFIRDIKSGTLSVKISLAGIISSLSTADPVSASYVFSRASLVSWLMKNHLAHKVGSTPIIKPA